jgi:hypothetical protein
MVKRNGEGQIQIGTDLLTAMDETPEIGGYPTDSTIYNSQLKGSIVKWLRDTGGYDWFACTNTKQYKSLLKDSNQPIDTALTNALSLVLLEKSGIAYNVDVRYPTTLASTGGNTVRNTKMIWNGDPSSNSVTVSRIIVLHDRDIGGNYCVIPDISNNHDTDLYNVVEVRLTMWVM